MDRGVVELKFAECAVPIPDSPLVIQLQVTDGVVAYAVCETAGGIIAARSPN